MSDFLQRTLECIEVQFEQEVQSRLEGQVGIDVVLHPTVMPVIFQTSNNYATGTIHRVAVINDYDIWATAKHVTDDFDLSALVDEYGDCYRLETKDLYDVHFFCRNKTALETFKVNCPSPEQAANNIGMTINTYNTSDAPVTAMTVGYPYGVINGNPQTRNLVPFTSSASNDVSNLLWLESLEGPVVGGMSGGKVMLINESTNSIGVLVATSYFDPLRQDNPKHYAAIQLFHNQMKIVPV